MRRREPTAPSTDRPTAAPPAGGAVALLTVLLGGAPASAQWGDTACEAGDLPPDPETSYEVSGVGIAPEPPSASCISQVVGDKWLRFSPPYPRRLRLSLVASAVMRYTGSCVSPFEERCEAGFVAVLDEEVFVSPGTTQYFRMGTDTLLPNWIGSATFFFPGGSECQQQPDDLGADGFPSLSTVAFRQADFAFNSSGTPPECPPYTGDLLDRLIFRDVIFSADFQQDGVLQFEISEPLTPTATYAPRLAVYTDDASPTELHFEVLPQSSGGDQAFLSGAIPVGPQTGSTGRLFRLGATVTQEPEIRADAVFRLLANNAVCENAEPLVPGVVTDVHYNDGLRIENDFTSDTIRRRWYEIESIGVRYLVIIRDTSDPFGAGGTGVGVPCPAAQQPSSLPLDAFTTIFYQPGVPPTGERELFFVDGAEGPGDPRAEVVLRHTPPGGDADGDGVLDRDDAALYCEALSNGGAPPPGASMVNMDLDMDGDIDRADVLAFCATYVDPDPSFHCLCPLNCPGNIDSGGGVLLSDFAILAANFGITGGATRCEGDLTGDGAVTLADFGIFASNFGLVCDAGTTLRTPCFSSIGVSAAPPGAAPVVLIPR